MSEGIIKLSGNTLRKLIRISNATGESADVIINRLVDTEERSLVDEMEDDFLKIYNTQGTYHTIVDFEDRTGKYQKRVIIYLADALYTATLRALEEVVHIDRQRGSRIPILIISDNSNNSILAPYIKLCHTDTIGDTIESLMWEEFNLVINRANNFELCEEDRYSLYCQIYPKIRSELPIYLRWILPRRAVVKGELV